MSSREQAILPDRRQPAILESPHGSGWERASVAVRKFLDRAIFLFLCLFAILVPHSIKGAQHAWQIAFLLWLLSLVIRREHPFPTPLAAPLLAYVTLSGISTALSPEPVMSWDRMKIVCLVLVAIVFAQNLRRLTQVRTLIYLLILSGVAAAGFTAWQYSYGIGVRIVATPAGSPLSQTRLAANDIITQVAGHRVHTASQLQRVIQQGPPDGILLVRFLRGFPLQKRQASISREAFLRSGLGSSQLELARGKPFRAQGTVGHYVIFAAILMQIGCLAWAMLLISRPGSGLSIFWAVCFLALTGALFVTETRSALAGMALGCFVALWLLAGRRSRLWAIAALVAIVIAGVWWIHHTRGVRWVEPSDPGTNFRVLMWEDGLRLVRQHPWFGVGMETYRTHWQQWNLSGFALYNVRAHFHSDVVQIAVERGLPALLAWLWFIVAYAMLLLKVIRQARERSRFAVGVAAGLLGGLLAFVVPGLLHYSMGEESLVMMLFFCCGVGIALDRMMADPAAVDVA